MINRNFTIRKSDIMNRRMFIIGIAKLIVFGGLITRLFSLQINDNKKYLTLSDKNRIREWKTPPQRGLITDFYNKVLADNDRVFQVHLSLDEIKDFDQTIFRLKTIINLSNNKIRQIYKTKEKLKPWDTLIVSDNLDWSEFSKLNLYLHELEGVKPVMTISRDYPFSDIYTHVLGYVSQPNEEDILANEVIQEKFGKKEEAKEEVTEEVKNEDLSKIDEE